MLKRPYHVCIRLSTDIYNFELSRIFKFRTAFKPSSNILPRAVILRRRGNHDLRCLTLLKLKERSLYSAESEYSFVLTSTMTAIAIGFIMLRHTGIFICRSIIVSGKRCYNIAAYVKPGKFWGAEAVEEKAPEEKAPEEKAVQAKAVEVEAVEVEAMAVKDWEERLWRQRTWMRY